MTTKAYVDVRISIVTDTHFNDGETMALIHERAARDAREILARACREGSRFKIAGPISVVAITVETKR